MIQGGSGWSNNGGMYLQPSGRITNGMEDSTVPYHDNEATWELEEGCASGCTDAMCQDPNMDCAGCSFCSAPEPAPAPCPIIHGPPGAIGVAGPPGPPGPQGPPR